MKQKIQVKIIEKNIEKCNWITEVVPKALIINGDPTDKQVLLEEGIDRMDAFVALNDLDVVKFTPTEYKEQIGVGN